jgi:hypothetical protein
VAGRPLDGGGLAALAPDPGRCRPSRSPPPSAARRAHGRGRGKCLGRLVGVVMGAGRHPCMRVMVTGPAHSRFMAETILSASRAGETAQPEMSSRKSFASTPPATGDGDARVERHAEATGRVGALRWRVRGRRDRGGCHVGMLILTLTRFHWRGRGDLRRNRVPPPARGKGSG